MSNPLVSAEARVKKALILLSELIEKQPTSPVNKLLQRVAFECDLTPKESVSLQHHFNKKEKG
ncbi:hypothetical protein [Desulfotalea psychrophila]|nr:hypothetical protein [Desulfotalea psychrophila]